jgi:signal transduction histidine kinase
VRLFPKLALLSAVVALVPLSVVGFSLIRTGRDAMAALLEAQHVAAASLCGERIARSLEETWTRLSALLALVDTAQPMPAEQAQKLLQALYRESEDIVSVQWVDAGGALRHPRVAPGDDAPAGRVPVSSEAAALLDTKMPALAKLEVPPGELVMSAPLSFLGRATPSVLLVFPVGKDRIVVELSLRAAERVFSQSAQSAQSRFALVAKDGSVLVQSAGGVLGKRLDLARVPAKKAFPFLSAAGSRAIAVLVPIGDTALSVLVYDDEAAVLMPAHVMQTQTLAGLSVAAALSLVVGFVMSRSLRRRLAHFDAAARQLGAGQLATRVEADKDGDELSVLGATLNGMAADLEGSRKEIEAWNRELQARVEARTAELKAAQARLVQAARLAAVGQLGAGVAHEIGNPLARIIGYAQLVKQDPKLDADAVDSLEKIEVAAKRVDDITKSLLRFSQTQSLPPEPGVRLILIAKEAAELVRSRFDTEGLELTLDVDPELALTCQPAQLVQALFQLLDNARKATRRGGKVTNEGLARGDRIVLGVRDTGAGIAKEDQDKLFDPFFTTKQEWQSPGLGLSLVYRICEAHHGETLVESELSKGSFVALVLPSG